MGIWSEGGGSGLALVIRKGDTAPGTGVNFIDFGKPVLNGAGQTAFSGVLTGTGVTTLNDTGIWSEGSGSLALVAREGSAAPGTIPGVNFASAAFTITGGGIPILNGVGQTAFRTLVSGTGVSTLNDIGIWAEVDNVATLVVREGDVLEVSPGIFKTVSTLTFIAGTGNEDGRHSQFNDRGQLVFSALFTDSTGGVFVAETAFPDLVTTPDNGGTLDIGNARVGTSASANLSVTNAGNAGSLLTGNIDTASGEFAGGGTAFSLNKNQSASALFSFTPIARGVSTQALAVTSNDENHALTLQGTGVAPVFASTGDVAGTLAFGSIVTGSTGTLGLNLLNISPDGDLGALTDLTILSMAITDIDANLFSVTGFTPGTVLGVGDSLALTLSFDPLTVGNFSATLTFVTDQGTFLGGTGQSFSFNLFGSGFSQTSNGIAVPEPTTTWMLLTAGALLLRRRGNEANSRRRPARLV